MNKHAYTEDQLVEQSVIEPFHSVYWHTYAQTNFTMADPQDPVLPGHYWEDQPRWSPSRGWLASKYHHVIQLLKLAVQSVRMP